MKGNCYPSRNCYYVSTICQKSLKTEYTGAQTTNRTEIKSVGPPVQLAIDEHRRHTEGSAVRRTLRGIAKLVLHSLVFDALDVEAVSSVLFREPQSDTLSEDNICYTERNYANDNKYDL